MTAAQDLDVPGPLRDENQQMIEALQLRVSGVQGLADTFAANPASKAAGGAALLAAQADRLLASDVVWDDLFAVPATQELKRQGVSGVSVPDSNFVANRDLTTERSMALLLTRLKGATTGGTPTGIHGTNIVDVKVLPGGQVLSQTEENTITATTDLAFVVTIADSGDSQEVGIKVTLTIQKPQGAIVKTKTVDLINPGQTKSVTFTDLGQVPFAQKTTLNVDVAAVPGEHNTDNNKASYRSSSRWGSSAVHVTATGALIVAIAGVVVGAIGPGLAWWAWVLVAVRDAQRLLLGSGRGSRRLCRLAAGRVDDLHRSVDEVAAGLRVSTAGWTAP